MPSNFLKKRYADFFEEVAGEKTITIFPFVESSAMRDPLTGDILNESSAYSSIPIELPALVNFNPSQAARAKIGLEIKFDVLLKIPNKHIVANSIDLHIGDKFVLPGDDNPFYIVKYFINRQGGDDFLDWIIAVSRGINKRG